jgi:DNA-binding GntR family transcriptional regulator
VRDICQLRAAVEGKAAQLVASEHPEAVGELEAVLAAIQGAGQAADARRAIELDLEFHDTLCRLSGNRRLHASFRANAPVLRTLFMLEREAFEGARDLATKHEHITKAMRTGEPATITQAIDQHMASSQRRLLEFVREPSPRDR